MPECLFCKSLGPFSTVEHIIPESLGNDELLLRNEVCDSCQSYFGKEIENYVLNKTPLAFWRVFLGIKTKRGQFPSIDLSQPKKQKGVFPAIHSLHDNISFSYHEDGSLSVDIADDDVLRSILDDQKSQFTFVFTPKTLHMLGRFLCKVGIELLCLNDPQQARESQLDNARRYARLGEFNELWPIFYFSRGNLADFRQIGEDDKGFFETVEFFSYSILSFENRYLLFRFSMGIDNWVICLNDPYPHPSIRKVFPNDVLKLIWYSKGNWHKK